MDELICRVINGRATRAEEAELRAWRQRSFENELHYRAMVEMLDRITETILEGEVDGPPLIEDLLSPRAGRAGSVSRTRFQRAWRAGVGSLAAAAVVAVVLLGRSEPEYDGATFGTGEIVTGASESTTVRLGDGSIVRLGPGSRLRVTADRNAREVWMEGRAYFAIARDESRPFRIRTHAGDAVVLGTRFDLEARDDDMKVLVVEGAVKLGDEGAEVEIKASEVGTVGDGGAPLRRRLEREELERELEWVGTFIAFENTPLSVAAQELTRRFGVPVVVLDSMVARETVRANFTDESLDEIARVLCRAVSVHCSIQPGGVTIGL